MIGVLVATTLIIATNLTDCLRFPD